MRSGFPLGASDALLSLTWCWFQSLLTWSNSSCNRSMKQILAYSLKLYSLSNIHICLCSFQNYLIGHYLRCYLINICDICRILTFELNCLWIWVLPFLNPWTSQSKIDNILGGLNATIFQFSWKKSPKTQLYQNNF